MYVTFDDVINTLIFFRNLQNIRFKYNVCGNGSDIFNAFFRHYIMILFSISSVAIDCSNSNYMIANCD